MRWRGTIRLSEQEEREQREQRRNRFRILVCINGTKESYEGLDLAARIGRGQPCDIIMLYVRRIDQGLDSGGLQVRVARQNMLDWGFELPGIQYLRDGVEILMQKGRLSDEWKARASHTDVWGDPLGDNKVEFNSPKGKSIVLKLKTAPTVASGILDQYELGPYNLIIMGPPKRWRGEVSSFWEPSSVQKVAMLSPCSVLTMRRSNGTQRGHLICIDGSRHCAKSMRQAAVLAHHLGEPVTIASVATERRAESSVRKLLSDAKKDLTEMGVQGVTTLFRMGDPVERILNVSNRYSLVVVSDSGKSRVKRFVRGSVAFDIMGRAPVSVLNVR